MNPLAPSPAWMKWFTWYARNYLRRHFHALRVNAAEADASKLSGPLVIFLNHASWWDPLVALVVTRHFFPARWFAAPIEATALERYGILRRFGFFGVEAGSLRGAKTFLRTSLEALREPRGGLCFTPQGRFADVRQRPLAFQPGLGQLAHRLEQGTLLPMAIEYPFWQERSPEIVVKFGAPLTIEPGSTAEWTHRCEQALTRALDDLAADSQARAAEKFTTLLAGRAGVGGIYDLGRRVRARWRGETFHAGHSTL